MPIDADASTIRDAYRRLARVHHPDARGGRSSSEMPAINEAYAVLSDPARRRDYDRILRAGAAPSTPSTPSTPPTSPTSSSPAPSPLPRDMEPPRFPWRFVLALTLLGITGILLIGALSGSPPPPAIDNVLQVGSCVELDETVGEVAEVACTADHAAVVEALVPFDARCGQGLEAFRDRQGLGIACVRRVEPRAGE